MVIFLLALPAVPRASAQQTPMETAADHLAGAIVHSKQKTVVVLDFSGPDNKITALGERLADDCTVALAKADGQIQIEDRSRVVQKRKEYHYALEIVLDPISALLFAQDVGAKAFVMGEMSVSQNDKLDVVLKAFRVDNGKNIEALELTLPISEEMKAMMAKDIPSDPPVDLSNYPQSGMAGYSSPVCLHCPRAEYSPEAMAKRVQGTVELIGVVGEDGLVTNILVRKGLPAGLTKQAIYTISKWQLKPATGPDGKPAAVRQIFEIAFSRY